jgi:predicted double-glycine peptidase
VLTVLGVLAFAVGCVSYRGTARNVAPSAVHAEPGWTRVDDVPSVRQTGIKDCGAAALSAVMRYWRNSKSAAALERANIDTALRQNPDEGLTALALRDYAREQGFHAFVFNGELSDLRHEVAAGRPVIVGTHKELSSKEFLSHYEVVIGFHPERDLVLSFDPARGLTENRLQNFLKEWKRAGQTTLVIAP